jgi:hypothetical protein
MHMRLFVICGLLRCTVFFPPHHLIQVTISGGKKSYWTQNVFFPPHRLPETFLVLITTERDAIKNVCWSSM